MRDGRIAAVGPYLTGAARTIDLPDAVLLPGLIDLHAHPGHSGPSGTVFGVDPDVHMLSRGVTTVLSQGDAGADTLQAYVEQTIEASKTRVLLAINLARVGESTEAGCFADLDDADVAACVAAVEAHRDHVWGIAVNASHHACGSTGPREVMSRGLEAARRTGLPILYGMRRAEDWPFEEQMQRLRPGDVVTYCFRSWAHCIVDSGRVHPAIRAARERGILFDVGHGTASFDFAVAEQAIADGFVPDTISTDLQRRHVGAAPPHDLPLVMSKLRAAGMAEADVFAAVTARPARILRRESQLGNLSVGACADLTALRWHPVGTLSDCHGNMRNGGRWTPLLTVRAGVALEPEPLASNLDLHLPLPNNVADELGSILYERGLVSNREAQMVPLAGGVSSDIWLVDDGSTRFVLKRARPRLNVPGEWFADVSRNRYEQEFLAYVGAFLPGAVPRVLQADADHGLFTMEYLDESFVTWKSLLLQGNAATEQAVRAAQLLAAIHRHSWNDADARRRFDSLDNFQQLRIEPYLLATARRHPALRSFFEAEANRLPSTALCLVHGDFSPKNIMIGPERMVLLDCEVAWFGDPAFDVAFLLNHFLLKALLFRSSPGPYLLLAERSWQAYQSDLASIAVGDLEQRVARLLLLLLLARIDGKSPVEYIQDEMRRQCVRNFVSRHLPVQSQSLLGLVRSWSAELHAL